MSNFSDSRFGNKAAGFDAPTQLPQGDDQRQTWQTANKTWWEATPMRYDWRAGIAASPGSKEYFEEVDRRFLSSVRKYLPWQHIPFEALIPFAALADKDVLEIGVGQGTHAQLIAPRCKSFTGIDLTEHAAAMTAKRFEVFGIPGRIMRMDAEEMSFPDGSFDYVWSWGVIHHSADTRRVLQEMKRVLRPGGKCAVMVYFRSWWTFYVCGSLRHLLQRQFRSARNLHDIAQAATDGAIARYFSAADWRALNDGLFTVDSVEVCGLKTELIPLPHGRLKRALEALLPDPIARVMLRRLHMGSFLVAHMTRV